MKDYFREIFSVFSGISERIRKLTENVEKMILYKFCEKQFFVNCLRILGEVLEHFRVPHVVNYLFTGLFVLYSKILSLHFLRELGPCFSAWDLVFDHCVCKLCAFPVSHIAIPSEDIYSIVIHPHRDCTSSPGMGMYLTEDRDVPHQECTSSPGMHILTGNAHSLYRVLTVIMAYLKLLNFWWILWKRFSNKWIYLLLGFSVIFAIKMKCHNSKSDPTRIDFRDLNDQSRWASGVLLWISGSLVASPDRSSADIFPTNVICSGSFVFSASFAK